MNERLHYTLIRNKELEKELEEVLMKYKVKESEVEEEENEAEREEEKEEEEEIRPFTFTFHFHALEKEMATHSSVLAWRIPGMGEPGGLPSMGSHRVGHD